MVQLDKIISISGKPGLFKLLTHSKNSFIAEELSTGKKMPVSSTQGVSLLDNVAIYTESEDMPLKDVFQKIVEYTKGEEVANPKSATTAELQELMHKVLPDYDQERVYVSDIKKLFNWYNLLLKYNLINTQPASASEEE